jgi:hypothetical protein
LRFAGGSNLFLAQKKVRNFAKPRCFLFGKRVRVWFMQIVVDVFFLLFVYLFSFVSFVNRCFARICCSSFWKRALKLLLGVVAREKICEFLFFAFFLFCFFCSPGHVAVEQISFCCLDCPTCVWVSFVDFFGIFFCKKKISQTWIGLGKGTNSIAVSSTGLTWTGRGTSIFSNNGNGVAFNGGRWVAVGDGTNSIATSTDNGFTWTGLGTSIFSTLGSGVTFAQGKWVALGSGTNSFATSTDGVTWTGRGTGPFSTGGIRAAFSATQNLWIAVGEGSNHTMANSTDGITWTGMGRSPFSTRAKGIAFGQNKWVAVGETNLAITSGNSIAYSTDGRNWTGLGRSALDVLGSAVAFSSTQNVWVAVGCCQFSFARSTDGITWSPLGPTGGFSLFANGANDVAFSALQGRWIAVGSGSSSIASSSDGTGWTGQGLGPFSNNGAGIGVSDVLITTGPGAQGTTPTTTTRPAGATVLQVAFVWLILLAFVQ